MCIFPRDLSPSTQIIHSLLSMQKNNPTMSSSFQSSTSSNTHDEFHNTLARASTDDGGEERLSSDSLLETISFPLATKHSIRRRYAPLIVTHVLIFLLHIAVLHLVASSYANSRRLNGPGIVFCSSDHQHGLNIVCTNLYTAPAREAILHEEQRIYSGEPRPELDHAWSKFLDSECLWP